MTLLHPGWLGLLALAAPIVAFHLRRRRRVRVVVPSLLAFDPPTLEAATPRGAGFRPRDLAGLLLELGALSALALAAADPVDAAAPPHTGPRPIAIVLDGSLSTAAAGRFEEMRGLARRALDAAGPDTPATLILAAGTPRVLATAADARERTDAALRDAHPAPRGAGALAAAADAAVESGAEVIVLTDGCDPDAPALAARQDLRLVSVGRPERNRAIVGAVLERRRGAPGTLVVRVLGEDGTVAEEDRSALLAELPPGAAALRVSLAAAGPPDALPEDDAIEVPIRAAAPLRVAVAAPGGRPDAWVAAALEACGDLLDRAVSATVDPSALGDIGIAPDALIAAGGPVYSRLPALVLSAGEGSWREAPSVSPGDRTHPVLRGVDPTEWILTRARAVEARAGDAVLLQGPEGPVAVAGVRDGARRVLLGFDPAASTVPLSASWPVLVRNSLDWLAGEPEPVLLPPPGAAPGTLPDVGESRLEPRVPRSADDFAASPRAAAGEGPRRLAPGLAALGAVLLLAEMLLFLRGAARDPGVGLPLEARRVPGDPERRDS